MVAIEKPMLPTSSSRCAACLPYEACSSTYSAAVERVLTGKSPWEGRHPQQVSSCRNRQWQ